MNYPNDFDTPAFPAGKTIAFSRAVSIWVAIVSFLIVCACGLMLLMLKTQNKFPFLIAQDPYTFDWDVVAYLDKVEKVTPSRIIQETIVKKYVQNWFNITRFNALNESLWQECTQNDCAQPEQFDPTNGKCALFCDSSPELFHQFTTKILPEYRIRSSQDAETVIVYDWLFIPPAKHDACLPSNIDQCLWHAYLKLNSSVRGKFEVLVFIELGYEDGMHPATLGYYVKDFNSYRISGI